MRPPRPTRRTALGAVLAGGESRRFGSPKAAALLDGVTLLEHALRAVGAVCPEMVVVGRPETAAYVSVPFLVDVLEERGPLSGIHAALLEARRRRSSGVLAVACDLPFLSPELLSDLLDAGSSCREPVTAAAAGGRRAFEPLCAYWKVEALEPLEACLRSGERATWRVAEMLGVRILGLDRVRRYGDPGALFLNVNSPGDHARAERWTRMLHPGGGGTPLAAPSSTGHGSRESHRAKGDEMAHVYKSIELVGISPQSFDDAVRNAVRRAGGSMRSLKWLEVVEQRGHVEGGEITEFQVKVKVWFELEEGG
jgi:molybdopterin-guanine dinucleotide biosynthesis protein A/flavin-binding protein dodecin